MIAESLSGILLTRSVVCAARRGDKCDGIQGVKNAGLKAGSMVFWKELTFGLRNMNLDACPRPLSFLVC